jgi:hypothetical protein
VPLRKTTNPDPEKITAIPAQEDLSCAGIFFLPAAGNDKYQWRKALKRCTIQGGRPEGKPSRKENPCGGIAISEGVI